jgi:glycosyltransferase involved in cell wall biosynthesis
MKKNKAKNNNKQLSRPAPATRQPVIVQQEPARDPLFSIIIPAYNCEKYISTCIDSITSQSFANYEIIIVNDCSQDRTASVIGKMQQKRKDIRCFSFNRNRGAGEARNLGASKAIGKYLFFVDSDDWLEKEALAELEKQLELNASPDLLVFNYTEYDSELRPVATNRNISNVKDSSRGSQIFNVINPAPWNKLIRRDFWLANNFSFPNKIHHQDLALIPYICLKAKRVAIVDKSLYCYNSRPGNVSTSVSSLHVISLYASLNYLFRSIKKDHEVDYYSYKNKLVEMAIFHMLYSWSVRNVNYSDKQVSKSISLFNAFNHKYKIDALHYLNSERGLELLKQLSKVKRQRRLDASIRLYTETDFFENMMLSYENYNTQYRLMISRSEELARENAILKADILQKSTQIGQLKQEMIRLKSENNSAEAVMMKLKEIKSELFNETVA